MSARGPQLEHGYVRIANELHEAITASQFKSVATLQVVLAVLRASYGWQQKSCVTSIPDLQKATLRNRSAVRRGLAEATQSGVLATAQVRRGEQRTNNLNIFRAWINKHYSNWRCLPEGWRPMSANSHTEEGSSGRTRPTEGHPEQPQGKPLKNDSVVAHDHGREDLAPAPAASDQPTGRRRPTERGKSTGGIGFPRPKDKEKKEDQQTKIWGGSEDLCRPRVGTPPPRKDGPLTARGNPFSGPLGTQKDNLARLAEAIGQPVRELVEVWMVAGEYDQTGGVRPAMQFVLRNLEDEAKITRALKSVIERSIEVEAGRGRYPASWAWQDFAERLANDGVNGYSACASDDNGSKDWVKLAADVEAGRDVWGTHEPG